MFELLERTEEITSLVLKQLNSFWNNINEDIIAAAVLKALTAIEKNFYGLPNKRFFDGTSAIFHPHMSIHWMIFLYRLSHEVYKMGGGNAERS